MELKDFQQAVLDTFDGYLDALVEKRLNALKVEKLIQADPDLELAVPDYSEKAWEALGPSASCPSQGAVCRSVRAPMARRGRFRQSP
jgi:hypothetical protein